MTCVRAPIPKRTMSFSSVNFSLFVRKTISESNSKNASS